MPLSLLLSCAWIILATCVALGPRRFHWPAAGVLIALGMPMVGFVTYQMGPWWGLGILMACASILRWPVFYLWRWLRSG